MEIKTNLNSRQFRLYDYLKSRGDQWTTQFQIVSDLTELYGYADKEHFHDSANRHQLTNDIRMINESDYIPKPILSSGRGVKIANEKEFDLFIASNINSAVKRLKRLKKLARKGNNHNQYRIKMSEYQKEVYEAFID